MFSRGILSLVVAALGLVQLVSASPINSPAPPRALTGPGISYSPYNDDNTCKSAGAVKADLSLLKGYGLIRLYGLDCQQVENVLPVAMDMGIPLFVGIYEVDKLDDQLTQLARAVGGHWSAIHTVAIGNEFVLAGKKTAQQMVDLTNQARDKLRTLKYEGPVVSVNVFYEILQNPLLCEGQDYIACNAHPFFDGNVKAADAGTFIKNMRAAVQEKCGGKYVLVSETGWPSQGTANREAVPSKPDQTAAIASIKAAGGNNVILFTAFNDLWKKDNPATFNAEKYWGIIA